MSFQTFYSFLCTLKNKNQHKKPRLYVHMENFQTVSSAEEKGFYNLRLPGVLSLEATALSKFQVYPSGAFVSRDIGT